MVDTRDAALAALVESVPTLILVSALLNSSDEEAVAAEMRARSDAGEVEMITIPLLEAVPDEADKPHGLLGVFKRKKKEEGNEGRVTTRQFAHDIKKHLERARQTQTASAGSREPQANSVRQADADVCEPGSTVERLSLTPALSAVQTALSARIAQLMYFNHPAIAHAHGLERDAVTGRLILVSDRVPGPRLPALLARASERSLVADLPAALFVMRRLLSALRSLHAATGVSHVGVAPSRIVVSPRAEFVMVETALAGAATGGSQEDPRLDIAQIALIGMSMMLGRAVGETEDADARAALVREVSDVATIRAGDDFATFAESWFAWALVIDAGRSFHGFEDASTALAEVERSGCVASRRALKAFVRDLAFPGALTPEGRALEFDRIRSTRARQLVRRHTMAATSDDAAPDPPYHPRDVMEQFGQGTADPAEDAAPDVVRSDDEAYSTLSHPQTLMPQTRDDITEPIEIDPSPRTDQQRQLREDDATAAVPRRPASLLELFRSFRGTKPDAVAAEQVDHSQLEPPRDAVDAAPIDAHVAEPWAALAMPEWSDVAPDAVASDPAGRWSQQVQTDRHQEPANRPPTTAVTTPAKPDVAPAWSTLSMPRWSEHVEPEVSASEQAAIWAEFGPEHDPDPIAEAAPQTNNAAVVQQEAMEAIVSAPLESDFAEEWEWSEPSDTPGDQQEDTPRAVKANEDQEPPAETQDDAFARPAEADVATESVWQSAPQAAADIEPDLPRPEAAIWEQIEADAEAEADAGPATTGIAAGEAARPVGQIFDRPDPEHIEAEAATRWVTPEENIAPEAVPADAATMWSAPVQPVEPVESVDAEQEPASTQVAALPEDPEWLLASEHVETAPVIEPVARGRSRRRAAATNKTEPWWRAIWLRRLLRSYRSSSAPVTLFERPVPIGVPTAASRVAEGAVAEPIAIEPAASRAASTEAAIVETAAPEPAVFELAAFEPAVFESAAPVPAAIEPTRVRPHAVPAVVERSVVEPPVRVEAPAERRAKRDSTRVQTKTARPRAAAQWRTKVAAVSAIAVCLAIGASAYYFMTPTTGTLLVESLPRGSEVYLDGVASGRAPVTLRTSPGTHQLELRRAGAVRRFTLDVAAGTQLTQKVDWTDVKATGSLIVTTDPAGAQVVVDDEPKGNTPVTLELPTGSHTVMVSSARGSVRRVVQIRSETETTLDESLAEGWVAVFAPFELQISEGKRFIGTSGGKVMMSAGHHSLVLTNAELGYRETRAVELNSGETLRINIKATEGVVRINAPAGTEVSVDGVIVGTTPLRNDLHVASGSREIALRHRELGNRLIIVDVTLAAPIVVDFDKRVK